MANAISQFFRTLFASKEMHFLIAGLSVGSVVDEFKPDLFWQTTVAVMFLFKAYDKMTYLQED